MSSINQKHRLTRTRTTPVPTHRVAVLRPFAGFLVDVGAPIEKEFRQAQLPISALEEINNYVPSQNFWRFLVQAAQREGIKDLGFRVGHQFGANSADPKLTSLLANSPSLYRGLMAASELTNRTVTNCQIGLLRPSADSETVYFFHQPSCDANHPAIDQVGWFGLTTLMGMVQAYTGPDWRPAEIGIMTDHPPTGYIRDELADTRINPLQKFSYIALDSKMLSLPPAVKTPSATDFASTAKTVSEDYVGSLSQIMQSYIKEGNMNIHLLAELSNDSVRTLQRKLANSGTRYSKILENVLYEQACIMLHQAELKITDISNLLGYSDPTHFTRAFRRTAGVSPGVYRQQVQQLS